MAKQFIEQTANNACQQPGKYLTFNLHHESCGVGVLKVREIIPPTSNTAIPQMPPHVREVINLRGKIIPVIDLRLRSGFPDAQSTDQACIIVVQVKLPGDCSIQSGSVVDGVEEAVSLSEADIDETPAFGAHIATDDIVGLAKIKGAAKTLRDIDRILTIRRPGKPS